MQRTCRASARSNVAVICVVIIRVGVPGIVGVVVAAALVGICGRGGVWGGAWERVDIFAGSSSTWGFMSRLCRCCAHAV